MKALIAPNESFNVGWVTSWKQEDGQWVPDQTMIIDNCCRVAEVQANAFPVAPPMYWVDCPDDCKADIWYCKDGQVQPRPQSAPMPEDNPTENQGE